ncbi:MAG TPA: hypothetical protein VFJ58_00535 [Armatimonadota bacterium]|nr:hypothetical protein [Armatimonadota bacterium]
MTVTTRLVGGDVVRTAARGAATALSFCSGLLLTVSDRLQLDEAVGRMRREAPEGASTGPVDRVELEGFLDSFFKEAGAEPDFRSAAFVLVRDGHVFFEKNWGNPVKEDLNTGAAPSHPLTGAAAGAERLAFALLDACRSTGRRVYEELPPGRLYRHWFTQHPTVPDLVYGFLETFTHNQRALFHTDGQKRRSLLYLLPDQRLGFYLEIDADNERASFHLRTSFTQRFLDRYYQ